MQNVLTHSINRLLIANSDLHENVMVVEGKYSGHQRRYLCYFKYGSDGLSGLTEFHQELDEDEDGIKKGGKILASHLIFLQIVCFIDELGLEMIVYTNPLMNAKDSCRPLRFWMVAENR